MISSCIPSAMCRSSSLALRLSNGSTATDVRDSPPVPICAEPNTIQPAATTPHAAKASTPPVTAFRQVRSFSIPPGDELRSTTSPGCGVAGSFPSPIPSCTKAVATTIGKPMMTRTSANEGNQAGS